MSLKVLSWFDIRWTPWAFEYSGNAIMEEPVFGAGLYEGMLCFFLGVSFLSIVELESPSGSSALSFSPSVASPS